MTLIAKAILCHNNMKANRFLYFILLLLVATFSTVHGQRYVEPPVPDDPSGHPPEDDEGNTTPIAVDHVIYFPIIGYAPAGMQGPYDMADFMIGDGRLYEVQHSSGSQARHQTQVHDGRFFHTKGHEVLAEWEELWATTGYIYRGTDTSPGNGQYYTLREHGRYGSAWSPRFWSVGDLFERNPEVTFYWKSDCAVVNVGSQQSWLRFDAYHLSYTFPSDITLEHVIELAWLPAPDGEAIETYFYAVDYGLVGWRSNNGDLSYISEIHASGTRPDNNMELIPCLNNSTARPHSFGPSNLVR